MADLESNRCSNLANCPSPLRELGGSARAEESLQLVVNRIPMSNRNVVCYRDALAENICDDEQQCGCVLRTPMERIGRPNRSKFDVFVSIAGGLVPDSVRSAYFNGGDVAVLNVTKSQDQNKGINENANFQYVLDKILDEIGY